MIIWPLSVMGFGMLDWARGHNPGWGRGQIIDYMAQTLITPKTLNAEKVVAWGFDAD